MGTDYEFYADEIPTPPHSLQTEQAVLNVLMRAPEAFDVVAIELEKADFYLEAHRTIFSVISTLADRDQDHDFVTVPETLERNGLLADVGGMPYFKELFKVGAAPQNARSYAATVRDKALLRKLIEASEDTRKAAYGPMDAGAQIAAAEERLICLTEKRERVLGGLKPIREISPALIERVERAMSNEESIGVRTGLELVDGMISAFEPGQLVIFAARPGMGKTALMMRAAEHCAEKQGMVAAVFSLEMPSDSLIARMVSRRVGIPAFNLLTGQINAEQMKRFGAAMHEIDRLPLYIDDGGGLTVAEIKSRAKRLKREHGSLDAVFIDYLQLMAGDGDNRNLQIEAMTRALKSLAKSLEVPVILLSQLNRGLESRPNKRPMLADLRDSGAIEQDADVVIFIYRDEVYDEETKDKGVAEMIIAKQRNGPVGTVKAAFRAEYVTFNNLDSRSE